MTKTTVKRTSLCLTQETDRQLVELCAKLGENKSQIITRALQMLYYTCLHTHINRTEGELEDDGNEI